MIWNEINIRKIIWHSDKHLLKILFLYIPSILSSLLILLTCSGPSDPSDPDEKDGDLIFISDSIITFDGPSTISSFVVTNKSNKNIEWDIDYKASWISISPDSGILKASEYDSIFVEVDRGDMIPGVYQDTLIVRILGHDNNAMIITNLTVPDSSFHPENGSWEMVESNTTQDLEGVQFVSQDVGWTYSSRLLLKSIDGGLSWLIQYASDSPPYIKSVYFQDEQLGWLLLSDSCLLHTQDGGASWHSLQAPQITWAASMFFIDDSIGWIGVQSGVYKTQDGGNTWVKQMNIVSSGLVQSVSFSFVNNQTGWFTYWTHEDDGSMGGPSFDWGYVYKTNNGGSSWENVSDFGGSVGKVIFFDENTGYVSAGGLKKSLDGGYSWTNMNLPGGIPSFLDRDYGWTAGSRYETIDGYLSYYHHLWVTTDGGESYGSFVESTDKYKWLNSIYFYNQSLGWAVGKYGKILRYNASE